MTKTILYIAAAVVAFVLTIFVAAFVTALLEVDPEPPTGCAGRNPPSTADSADLNGCARRPRR